jgi:hypothetical protein
VQRWSASSPHRRSHCCSQQNWSSAHTFSQQAMFRQPGSKPFA